MLCTIPWKERENARTVDVVLVVVVGLCIENAVSQVSNPHRDRKSKAKCARRKARNNKATVTYPSRSRCCCGCLRCVRAVIGNPDATNVIRIAGRVEHFGGERLEIASATAVAVCSADICPSSTCRWAGKTLVVRAHVEAVVEAVDACARRVLRASRGVAGALEPVLYTLSVSDLRAVVVRAHCCGNSVLSRRLNRVSDLHPAGDAKLTVLAAVALMATAYLRLPAPVGVAYPVTKVHMP